MTTLTRRRPIEVRPLHVLRQTLTSIFGQLIVWQDRYVERRRLLTLSDRMLRDIGLSRADIEREANKPFWRL